MRYLFLISGEFPELASAEIELFANAKIKERTGFAIIADADRLEQGRLAYTKAACKFLFSCRAEELFSRVQSYGWNKIYRESFYVHIRRMPQDYAKRLADIIWHKLEKPKVEFKNARTQIDFALEGNKVFCGIRIYENTEDFEARKAHKRPGFSPISLHPKLARALVNMTGIKKGGKLLDPFCGTGGILIEAGLMNLKATGSDIDDKMLEKAKANLEAYGIKSYKLVNGDARKIKIKCDAIATDPPYGKASSIGKQNRKQLYSDFLANAYRILNKKSRLAIIFPNRISVKSKFKTLKRIDIIIHKSLTRTITILEK